MPDQTQIQRALEAGRLTGDAAAATGMPTDPHHPLGSYAWVEPIPEDFTDASPAGLPEVLAGSESLELGFLAALQQLPPRQRAALILSELVGVRASEVADLLDADPSVLDGLVRQARQVVDEHAPAISQRATLGALGDRRVSELSEQYMAAWENANPRALARLLRENTTLAAPPRPTWIRGRDDITRFAARGPLARGASWHMAPTRANGQIAFGGYRWDERQEAYTAHGIQVLRLDLDGAIGEIVIFAEPALFESFGLPTESHR